MGVIILCAISVISRQGEPAMLRRVVLALAFAVSLILAPTVAMAAYNAPGFAATVSDPSPATGQPVTVTLSGVRANEAVTLRVSPDSASVGSGGIRIDGTVTTSLTKTANASGVASFTVTLSAAGSFTLTFTNAAGAVVSTQTLVAHAVGGASGVVAGGASGGGGQLSRTGFEGAGLAVGGGLLVVAGAGAMVLARRRKTAHLPG